MRTALLLLAIPACATPSTPAALLDRSAAALAVDTLAAFTVYATGTLDKRAEGQGIAPDSTSSGPLAEALAIDQHSRVAAWDYNEVRYDGTVEHVRQVVSSDSVVSWVVHDRRLVVPTLTGEGGAARQSLIRRVPHLLVAEVRAASDTVLPAPSSGGWAGLRGVLAAGDTVTLHIDSDGLLRRASYERVVPVRGRVRVVWWYDDWRDTEVLGRYPARWGVDIAGQPYMQLRLDSIVTGAALVQPPDEYHALPLQRPAAGAAPQPLAFEELAAGVYRVPELRSGFAPLVVEFTDHVVVVDAPVSFPLFGQLPAGETDAGPNMSWPSERLVDAIAARFPGKPLRSVILTHHHEDHAGGVRAMVAAGASVIAAPAARAIVERALAIPATEANDRFARAPQPLHFIGVDSLHLLGDGEQRVEVINVGPNPHATGMLVVRLPRDSIMYVSDLVTPGPLDRYPAVSHAALDRWFGAWLREQGLDPLRVYSMHGAEPLTRAHRARL